MTFMPCINPVIQSPSSLFNFDPTSRGEEILSSLRRSEYRREMEWLEEEYQRVWSIEPDSAESALERARELYKLAERYIKIRSYFMSP